MNGKTKFIWAVTLYHTQNTHGHWQVRMSFDACNHGLNTSFRLFCLFVTKEILYSIIAGSDHGSYAKPLLLHVFLTPRQALSSHPHQQMVWLYWLQDRDSIPNWYTINHPTTLHIQWNPVTHCCSPMVLCTVGCIPQAKLPSLDT